MKHLQKIPYKILFAVLFLAVAGIVFFLKIGSKTDKVSAAWWNDNWRYRKAISVVNNTDFDATNIPYKITLDTQTLITNNKLQADADDIRILDSEGKIVRSQVEQHTLNTDDTIIWFETTVESNSTSFYYIYYGNLSVSAEIFETDIESIDSTSTTVTAEMKDGFGYSSSASYAKITDIRKDSLNLGVDGNRHHSGSYPGNWWNDRTFTQTILDSDGPLFIEVNYSDSDYGSYSSFGTNIKIFDNGFAETQIFTNYNTSGSESFYYYLSFLSGTRNSVWIDESGNLVDQDTNSGTLTESSLGQSWFGQRWTDTDIYGGTIITKNGSDWNNGSTSAQSSYYQTNYSYTESFTDGSSREIRYGVFAGDGGLSEMQQKGANYGAIGLSLADEELSPAPIVYWKFNEGVGTTAYDSSTSKYNGTLYGSTLPVWINEDQCFSGKCLSFNGNNSYVDTNYDFSYGYNDSATISVWINPSTTDTSGKVKNIISKNGYEYFLTQQNSYIRFIHWNPSGGDAILLVTNSNTIEANKWQYITYVYDGSAHQAYLYINGKLKAQTTPAYTEFKNTTETTKIGRGYGWGGSSTPFFNGLIDEVKIYPYARTIDQIKLDYNSRGSIKGSSVNLDVKSNTSPSLSSNLLDHWKFDNNLNNSVSNRSSATAPFSGSPSFISNGKKNQSLDFTRLYNGSFTYINTNTFQDSTKSWATNELIGYQFATNYPPNSSYCGGTITSNTSNTFTTSTSCSSWSEGKNYRIKKSIYITGPVLNHSTDQISVSVWFKSNRTHSARIMRGNNELVHLSITNTAVSVGAISYLNSVSYAVNPHDGKWHHLAVVYDGSTQKIYYDGLFRNSSELTGSLPSNGNLTIGARNDGRQEFFDGLIDEVKVYNVALTDEEIKQDYNQGSATTFGTTNQTIGNTTTSLEYCIPGDTSHCAIPIGEWNFKEHTGTTTEDASGNNLTGTFGVGNSAPNWKLGKNNIGSGVNFDTNGQFIKVPLGSSASNFYTNSSGKTLSFSFWFKSSNVSQNQYLVNANSPCNNKGNFATRLSSGNLYFGYYGSAGGTKEHSFTPSTALQNNKWYHLTWTKTFGQLGVKAYLNGVSQTVSGDSDTLGSNMNTLVLGAWNGDGSTCTSGVNEDPPVANMSLNGSLDQVRIYNYIRTPAQVTYDYNKGAPIGWWKLDECQGSTAHDSSGNNNDGTITIGSSGSQNSLGTCQIGTSAAWTNGSIGKNNSSLSFDGIDDYLVINQPKIKLSPNLFTITGFVNPEDTASASIITPASNGIDQYIRTENNKIRLNITEFADINNRTRYSKVGSVPSNEWTHFSISIDDKNIKIYINGALDSEYQETIDIGDWSNVWRIGQRGNSTNWYKGKIDDLKIYNYELTSEQVKQVYNGGSVNFR